MSAKTPDSTLSTLSRGGSVMMTGREWREFLTDMSDWFTWWGQPYTVKAKSMGAGMYKITATKGLPQ